MQACHGETRKEIDIGTLSRPIHRALEPPDPLRPRICSRGRCALRFLVFEIPQPDPLRFRPATSSPEILLPVPGEPKAHFTITIQHRSTVWQTVATLSKSGFSNAGHSGGYTDHIDE